MFKKTYQTINGRQHPRVEAPFLLRFEPAELSQPTQPALANVKDISAGGIRFWANQPVREGGLVKITLLFSQEGETITILARVIRSRRAEDKPVYYTAAYFLEMKEEDYQALTRFIEDRRKALRNSRETVSANRRFSFLSL